jgi:hypothetical protein
VNNEKISAHMTMHLEAFLHSPEDVVGPKDFTGIQRTVKRLLDQYFPDTPADTGAPLSDNQTAKKQEAL